MTINSFSGDCRFLSNFWICPVWVEYAGRRWQTTEQAYQAAKLKDSDRFLMDKMDEDKITPGRSKKIGQEIDIRSDWNEIKISVMTYLNEQKYDNNPELMELLMSTKGQKIIEGNTWGDTFWGQSPIGTGRNELGKILMAIRDNISC